MNLELPWMTGELPFWLSRVQEPHSSDTVRNSTRFPFLHPKEIHVGESQRMHLLKGVPRRKIAYGAGIQELLPKSLGRLGWELLKA